MMKKSRLLFLFLLGVVFLKAGPSIAVKTGDDNFSAYNGTGDGGQCLENSDCSEASNLVCGDAGAAFYFPFESSDVYPNDYATDTFSTLTCDTNTAGYCPNYTADHAQSRFVSGMTLPLSYDANYDDGLVGDQVTQAASADQRDGSGAFEFPSSCPSTERCVVHTLLELDESATGAATMMAWVKPTASTNDARALISTGEKAWSLQIGTHAANVWCVTTGGSNRSGGALISCSTSTFTANTWYHVAAVFDGASATALVYVNGELDFTATGVQAVTGAEPLQVGGETPTGRRFIGIMDDAAAFEKALTADEIKAVYDGGVGDCQARDCATAGDSDCTEGNLACNADSSLCHTTCCSDGSVSCADANTRNDAACQSGGTCQSDGTCAICGDGTVESDEACDGSDLNEATCVLQGFAAGEVKCGTDCQLDTAACCTTASTYYADGDGDNWGDSSIKQEACSRPTGYVGIGSRGSDCNDGDASIHPGATETCNGIDDDCDGLTDEILANTTYYADDDGDGCGTNTKTKIDCQQPAGYVTSDYLGDCSDADATVCETITYYTDTDGDSYGTTSVSLCSATAPSGYSTVAGDCDDTDATVWERQTYYVDSPDHDGYGGTEEKKCSATPPSRDYVTVGGDCDSFDANIYPGATETCNGKDDDCDGQVDEGVMTSYYYDGDGDGYGMIKNMKKACSLPSGYATKAGDCNDSCATCNPGAKEIRGDGKDNDCDGKTDELFGP